MGDNGGGNDDRRSSTREPVTLKVEYPDASELVADYTENISNGGTFVFTERTFDEGTPLRLVLSFPGLIKPLPVTGIVRWVKTEPPEERGVGVEFEVANPEMSTRLSALVQRIADGDPELVARNLRVLVVEDNPHVATLIRDGLAGGGRRELAGRVNFQFTTVSNGREALEVLKSRPFDVLIIDIYLPILDGAQVITQVRADEMLRDLPIVAVSAGGAAARDAALAAGADFFLEKPMRLADIVATMRRLTGLI
jgi:uncharacterized protein (TIGR02266 family)